MRERRRVRDTDVGLRVYLSEAKVFLFNNL